MLIRSPSLPTAAASLSLFTPPFFLLETAGPLPKLTQHTLRLAIPNRKGFDSIGYYCKYRETGWGKENKKRTDGNNEKSEWVNLEFVRSTLKLSTDSSLVLFSDGKGKEIGRVCVCVWGLLLPD